MNHQVHKTDGLIRTKSVLVYPFPYLVLSERGYTKHYYAGADLCGSREQSQVYLNYAEMKQSVHCKRVAARMGIGLMNAITRDPAMVEKATHLFYEQSLAQVNHRELAKNDLECIQNSTYWQKCLMKEFDDIPRQIICEAKIDLEDLRWVMKEREWENLYGWDYTLEDFYKEKISDDETDVYFYHSDHLGSASWITNHNGDAVQHIQYLPYGEPYVNERPFGYSERFLFTGKERDEETGYGYFGARYMDHELLTSFISVDRYASKYPSISPYAYCAWNPIKLIDPTGDTLDIRGGAQAQADILSIVDPQYRDRITFQNDRVNVNVEGLSKEEIEADAGFSTIHNLVNSNYHYQYCVSETDGEGKVVNIQNH